MNHYANKKSAAESMLDVALLMANASQLKAVLEQGQDFSLYTPLVTLISISLILQIMVGIMLIFIGMLCVWRPRSSLLAFKLEKTQCYSGKRICIGLVAFERQENM